MDEVVDIEFQDDRGGWKRYSTVPNDSARIERALQTASADPRAVDARIAEKVRPAA